MRARDEYLAQVQSILLRDLPRREAREVLAEARVAVTEAFDAPDESEQRAEIEELFGEPETFAADLVRTARATRRPSREPLAGEVLGVPFDVRVPTAERVAGGMWNPSDPRLFVPRILGLGWNLNLAAVAVRLGLLRPDDIEDVPFSGVPKPLTAALSFGSAATLFAVGVWAVATADAMPPSIPTHFGLAGPDRFGSPLSAAGQFVGVALAIAGVASVASFRRRASALARAMSGAVLPALTVTMLGFYANAIAWATRGHYLVPSAVPVIAGLATLFALLLLLTKTGLRREWRGVGVSP